MTRFILLVVTLMVFNINIANACEYTHSGITNKLIRNYFLQMRNEYQSLYPECNTITCFRFHYDENGCLRAVYFVPVSTAQTPQVFHIRSLYGEFDHLNFWTINEELIAYGVLFALTPVLLGYAGASIKYVFSGR